MIQTTDTPDFGNNGKLLSYMFHQPFNKKATPFLVEEAAKGHPVIFGTDDTPLKILSVDGGGMYPIIAMLPAPPGGEALVIRANQNGCVKGSPLKLYLLERTVTQYLCVTRVGQSLHPIAKFYTHRSEAEGGSSHQYAVVPVEIPVPWDYPEHHAISEDDLEDSEHEDC